MEQSFRASDDILAMTVTELIDKLRTESTVPDGFQRLSKAVVVNILVASQQWHDDCDTVQFISSLSVVLTMSSNTEGNYV